VTIQREVRHYIQNELRRDIGSVGDADSLLEAGAVDSLGVLALVSFIEGQYGVTVSDDDMMPENFDSIDAIAVFVERRRSARD